MEGKHKIAPAPIINNHDIENDQENNSNISGKYHIKNLDTGNVMDIREYAQLGQEENERLAHIPPPMTTMEQQEQSNSNETTGQKLRKSLLWFSTKVAEGVDYVGETFVNFFGFDESHFQEMIDMMSEEEKRKAIEIHQKRIAEYNEFFAANPNHPKHPKNFTDEKDEEIQMMNTVHQTVSEIVAPIVAIITDEPTNNPSDESTEPNSYEQLSTGDIELQLSTNHESNNTNNNNNLEESQLPPQSSASVFDTTVPLTTTTTTVTLTTTPTTVLDDENV